MGKADIKVKVDQSAGLKVSNQWAQKLPQPTKASYYIELADRTCAMHVFMMGDFFSWLGRIADRTVYVR